MPALEYAVVFGCNLLYLGIAASDAGVAGVKSNPPLASHGSCLAGRCGRTADVSLLQTHPGQIRLRDRLGRDNFPNSQSERSPSASELTSQVGRPATEGQRGRSTEWRARGSPIAALGAAEKVTSKAPGQPPVATLEAGDQAVDHATGADTVLQGLGASTQVQTAVLATLVPNPQGYLARIRKSKEQIILGFVLLFLAFLVLCPGERWAAQAEALVCQGQRGCRSLPPGQKADPGERGGLVHLQGERMVAKKPVQDPLFQRALMKDSCVQLRRTVQVYQHIGTGAAREGWSSTLNASTKLPEGLVLGSCTTVCSVVEYGMGFLLGDHLVRQCKQFQPVEESHFGMKISFGGRSFTRHPESQWYYCPEASTRTGAPPGQSEANGRKTAGAPSAPRRREPIEIEAAPCIGDARVLFEYVPDGPATVVALQVAGERGQEAFQPYRLISRGLCGLRHEVERERLMSEAQKSKKELVAQGLWSAGPMRFLCCAFNCVAARYATDMSHGICHLWNGSRDSSECFQALRTQFTTTPWKYRLLGWPMLFVGLHLAFSPLLALLVAVPFVEMAGSGAIFVFCLIVTTSLGALIICAAYATHIPEKAALWAAAALGVMGLLWLLPEVYILGK